MTSKLRAVGPVVLAAIATALAVGTLTTPAEGAPPTTQTSPATLARAGTIQSDVNRRIRLASHAALAAALSREAPVDRSATALTGVLRGEGRLDPAAALQRTVDAVTRPRTYLFLDFEPGPYGPMSWAGMPCWPIVDW